MQWISVSLLRSKGTQDRGDVCAILTGEDGSYSGNDEGEDDSRAGIVARHHAGH